MENFPKLSTFSSKIQFLWRILAKHKSLVISVLLLETVLSLFNAIIPYFTKLQVDQLQSKSAYFFLWHGSPVVWFGVLLVAPAMIELARLVIFERLSRASSYTFTGELQLAMEKIVWTKLESLDAGFFENKRNERILTSAIVSTSVANDFFRFLRERLGNFTTVIAIIPLLGFVSWQLLIFVAAMTFLQVILSEISRKQEIALSTLEDRQREKFWKVEWALTHDFHTLKTLGASQHFLDQYQTLSRERVLLNLKRENANQVLRTYEWILNNALTVGANLFVGWQVLQGNLSLGTFTLVVSYTLQLNNVFRSVMSSMKDWRDIDLSFDRLQFFFMLKARIQKVKNGIKIVIKSTKIEFKNVRFTYPDLLVEERKYLEMMIAKTKGFLSKFSSYYYQHEFEEWQKVLAEKPSKQEVLKGVDLKIPRGRIVALLGRNGAGKTTITHLTMHHYEPTRGEVLLDGKSLFKYDQNQLATQFGVIEQSPFILYRFTVRENLLLGDKTAISDEEIWKVLAKLDIQKMVEELPKGLDTVLGEGTNLSGGQEQLLAVARVLLRRKPFLIFDEGMNQMDIEHETRVMNVLREQAKGIGRNSGAGVLFITHRITTARKADYIYMLDQGRIVEEGTHDELLKKDGLYAAFWKMQVIE